MKRRSGSAVLRGLVLSAALVSLGSLSGSTPTGAHAAAAVQIAAREFLYVPKGLTAPPGEVTFVVRNEGAIEHNFVLEDEAKKKLAEIPILEPGQTLEASATLRPGTYTIYCSLPGHRDAGMIAMLKVQ